MEIATIVEVFNSLLEKARNNETDLSNVTCLSVIIPTYKYQSFFLIPGLLIPIFLGFFIRRQSLFQDRCHGRPGLIIPINVLEMRHNRIGYLLAFGAIVSLLVNVLFDTPLSLSNSIKVAISQSTGQLVPNWASALIKIVSVVVLGTSFYPLFCVLSAEQIKGYILGIIYGVAYFIMQSYNYVQCYSAVHSAEAIVLGSLVELPPIICLILLLCYYLYLIIGQLRGHRRPSEEAREKEYMVMRNYVRNLLRKEERVGIKTGIFQKLRNQKMFYEEGFIFPPIFLCSLLVAAIVLYMIALKEIIVVAKFIELFKMLIYISPAWNPNDQRNMWQVLESIQNTNASSFVVVVYTKQEDAMRILYYIVRVFEACWWVSLTISLLATITHFPFIMINFRRNVLLAYVGKYPIVRRATKLAPAAALGGFSKYCAYQAAYLSWGFIILTILLLIITLFLAFVVIIPIMYGFGQMWIDLVKNFAPYLAILFTVIFVQQFINRLFFVQKPSTLLAVDNRKIFFIWTYYLFFYNLFIGAVSCIVRILKSLIVGVIFLGRVDFPVMPRLFENLDPGFSAYCGYVATEIYHNHPVLRTFLNILTENGEHIRKGRVNPVESDVKMNGKYNYCLQPVTEDTKRPVVKERRQLQIIFRWQLTYTLLRNPTLQFDRRIGVRNDQPMEITTETSIAV